MRLWSLHPRYLDAKGLVALWREALLAQAVLRRRTQGYRHHPQLDRFKAHARPVTCVNAYLKGVHREAIRRGYAFDGTKVGACDGRPTLYVSSGQVAHEWDHLLRKLSQRAPARYRELRSIRRPDPHPMFRLREGHIEPWERRA